MHTLTHGKHHSRLPWENDPVPSPAEGSRGQQPVDSNLKDGLNPGVLIEVPVFSLPALCITASNHSQQEFWRCRNEYRSPGEQCLLPLEKDRGHRKESQFAAPASKGSAGAGNTAHLKNFQNVGR